MAADSPTGHPTAPPRLLLVEDEDALRSLLARFLDRAGYRVEPAATGAEALQRFSEDPTAFHAAVVDLTLPDMSGESLLALLREIAPGLPVVLSSGTARSAAEFAAPDSPPARFLQKPFLPARLAGLLAELAPAQSSSPSTAS